MNKDKVIPISSQIEEKIEIIENTINIQSTILKKNINSFYYGWRNFAFKNDIINIAIGMIIASSFKNVVKSLVVDIIIPCLIGFGVGSNTEDLFIILREGTSNRTYNTLQQAKDDGAVTLNYGLFLHVFIDLIFVSIILYLTMRLINKIKKEMEEELKRLEN
jgi:large conductance mechanosensitive channel